MYWAIGKKRVMLVNVVMAFTQFELLLPLFKAYGKSKAIYVESNNNWCTRKNKAGTARTLSCYCLMGSGLLELSTTVRVYSQTTATVGHRWCSAYTSDVATPIQTCNLPVNRSIYWSILSSLTTIMISRF